MAWLGPMCQAFPPEPQTPVLSCGWVPFPRSRLGGLLSRHVFLPSDVIYADRCREGALAEGEACALCPLHHPHLGARLCHPCPKAGLARC